MILSNFIGKKIINAIVSSNNKWVTTAIDIKWVDLYGSLYDGNFRVKKKYLQIKEFIPFYNMSLEELHEITAPLEKSRCVILGTTEFLFPYIAYCLKFIEKYDQSLDIPFIIYAPCEWNLIDNITMIDYISNFYKSKMYQIIIILPKDNNKWFTADNLEPRITIMEMYRLFLNLGDIEVHVEEIEDKYKITIYNNDMMFYYSTDSKN
jgi:hypothetical protein